MTTIGRGGSWDARTFHLGSNEQLLAFDEFLDRHYRAGDRWGGRRIPPINRDARQLKFDADCRIFDGLWNRRSPHVGYPFSNNFIWHSCAGSGGNSGGALVNSAGHVVGVIARGARTLGDPGGSRNTAPGLPQGMAARIELFNNDIPGARRPADPDPEPEPPPPTRPSGCHASGLTRVWRDFGNGSGRENQQRLICQEFFQNCDLDRPRSFIRDTSRGEGWHNNECFYFGATPGEYDSWAPLNLRFINDIFLTRLTGTEPHFLRNECSLVCPGARRNQPPAPPRPVTDACRQLINDIGRIQPSNSWCVPADRGRGQSPQGMLNMLPWFGLVDRMRSSCGRNTWRSNSELMSAIEGFENRCRQFTGSTN